MDKTLGGILAVVILALGGWWVYRKYYAKPALVAIGGPAPVKGTAAQQIAWANSLPTFDVSRAFGPLDLNKMPWLSSYVDSDGRVRG